MRIKFLEETFGENGPSDLTSRFATPTAEFSKLVAEMGLSPSTDFRHSDLVGVDFSGANLSHFDFTGADLRGSFGIDVTIGTAVLDDAQISGSLFEYGIRRKAFFDVNPESAVLLKTLSAEHWTNAALWVAEQVGRRRRDEAIEIAKALYLDTKDAVLRNQILFFLSRAFNDRQSYLAFLLETLASHGRVATIRRSVIGLMGQLFYNQRAVYELMKRELAERRQFDLREILVALARSNLAMADFNDLMKLVRSNVDATSRKFFVQAFIKLRSAEYGILIEDRALVSALDHGSSISDRLIWSAARVSADRSSPAKGRLRPTKTFPSSVDFFERLIDVRAQEIRARLHELSSLGLDLEVEPPTARPRRSEGKGTKKPWSVPEGRRILQG